MTWGYSIYLNQEFAIDNVYEQSVRTKTTKSNRSYRLWFDVSHMHITLLMVAQTVSKVICHNLLALALEEKIGKLVEFVAQCSYPSFGV